MQAKKIEQIALGYNKIIVIVNICVCLCVYCTFYEFLIIL